MTKRVFDLDGTLVDTKRAVTEAYLRAGVHMPESAWGHTWREWLINAHRPLVYADSGLKGYITAEEAEQLHWQKNQRYPECLAEFALETKLMLCLRDLKKAREFRFIEVITGASYDAVYSLVNYTLPKWLVITAGLTRDAKINWLAKHGYGVYVDDDPVTRELVKELTTWKVETPEEALKALQPSS